MSQVSKVFRNPNLEILNKFKFKFINHKIYKLDNLSLEKDETVGLVRVFVH